MIPLDELLTEDRVSVGHEASDRRSVLSELGRLLGGRDSAAREAIRDDLTARERVGTTGVGNGVAFPHARIDQLPALRLAFVRTFRPVDFDALDGRPVDLFVSVAGPRGMRREYLSVLSRLSWMLRGESARESLREARTPREVTELFRQLAESDGPGT
jgi:PTS system nitrogen regulatory IIA component